jgi:hypothetical protein
MTRKGSRRSKGKPQEREAAGSPCTQQQHLGSDECSQANLENESSREGGPVREADDAATPALRARALGTAAYKKGNYQQAVDVRFKYKSLRPEGNAAKPCAHQLSSGTRPTFPCKPWYCDLSGAPSTGMGMSPDEEFSNVIVGSFSLSNCAESLVSLNEELTIVCSAWTRACILWKGTIL